MSTGSISLDILLNKILTDAISGGNESIRAIQKRYPSLSEKEAHEILAMVSATAQSNDDSAELVVTAPPSFALKTKPTKVTVRSYKILCKTEKIKKYLPVIISSEKKLSTFHDPLSSFIKEYFQAIYGACG